MRFGHSPEVDILAINITSMKRNVSLLPRDLFLPFLVSVVSLEYRAVASIFQTYPCAGRNSFRVHLYWGRAIERKDPGASEILRQPCGRRWRLGLTMGSPPNTIIWTLFTLHVWR